MAVQFFSIIIPRTHFKRQKSLCGVSSFSKELMHAGLKRKQIETSNTFSIMRSYRILLGLAAGTAVQSSQIDVSLPLANIIRSEHGISEAIQEGLLSARSSETTPLKSKRESSIPIVVTNLCTETIWPAFASQAGTGPGTGGFELTSGSTKNLTVGGDWQGRVWGRTNCTFNADGSGASNLNGNNGAGAACVTGDCNGVLNCVVTVCCLKVILWI